MNSTRRQSIKRRFGLWAVGLAVSSLVLTTGAAPAQTPSEQWLARTKIAQQQGMGESAPDWMVNAETYASYSWRDTWNALAQSKVAFITHCPANREYFARCRALNIRTFPYVTFFHANTHGDSNMFYTSVNLREHPEWIEIDAKGERKRSKFWVYEDMKNEYLVCPNTAGYQEAMVAQVRRLMEMGADGVFVDVVTTREECHGQKFGVHKHLYDDQNHAYAMLLKRVRAEIKKIRPDGALIGNSGNIAGLPQEFVPHLDADMLESYILSWASNERNNRWLEKNRNMEPYVRAGKVILAHDTLGSTAFGMREDGFFAYASAQLGGLIWNEGLSISIPEIADLHRIRLGKPLTEAREENGVYYRAFENGLVAVNPDNENARSIGIAAPIPTTRFEDIFGGGALDWQVYGEGYRLDATTKRSGAYAMACSSTKTNVYYGALQEIQVHQAQAKPIIISGWSKAQNVSGTPDANYSLYADVKYTDGTSLYGQYVSFDGGTHDWQQKSFTLNAPKPIRSLAVFAMFRNKSGNAWFDDISVREEGGEELMNNGGFTEPGHDMRRIDVSTTGGQLEIPAASGRVLLYSAGTADQVANAGPVLTIITAPGLGEVRFKLDGVDMWTKSGRWTTEYILGPQYGRINIRLEKPGKHTIEIVDVIPNALSVPAGYGTEPELAKLMDPADPTRLPNTRTFHFRGWEGRGNDRKIEVDVTSNTEIIANFEAVDN